MWKLGMGIALCVVAAVATWFDVRERRLPNALTVGALATALVLRAPGGLGDIGDGVAGALLGFGLALPFFLVGGLGGGDVKLLTAVGGFLGPSYLWFASLVMALFGAVMAIGVIIRHRAFRQTAVNLKAIFLTLGPGTFTGWKGADSKAAVTLETEGVLTVPYGVAIAAGALASWFTYAADPSWSLTETLAGWLS
ncbi:MAG: A24 family peptidase [Gemmatimonadetes bacterium]|nr:A24 family peptidase [Gemmatimonadota bacterium]